MDPILGVGAPPDALAHAVADPLRRLERRCQARPTPSTRVMSDAVADHALRSSASARVPAVVSR
jgi:hypothetical protein